MNDCKNNECDGFSFEETLDMDFCCELDLFVTKTINGGLPWKDAVIHLILAARSLSVRNGKDCFNTLGMMNHTLNDDYARQFKTYNQKAN